MNRIEVTVHTPVVLSRFAKQEVTVHTPVVLSRFAKQEVTVHTSVVLSRFAKQNVAGPKRPNEQVLQHRYAMRRTTRGVTFARDFLMATSQALLSFAGGGVPARPASWGALTGDSTAGSIVVVMNSPTKLVRRLDRRIGE